MALTFDVDGEAPRLSEGPGYARRLTTLSQGRFGPVRGLGRILSLLTELDVKATFYVPGHTADQHPGAVEAIVAGGHEIGHHGYLHRGTDALDAAAQRAERAGERRAPPQAWPGKARGHLGASCTSW